MAHPLDHSPPRLSDLPPDDLRAALSRRHDANRAAWERAHADASLPFLARIVRAFSRGA